VASGSAQEDLRTSLIDLRNHNEQWKSKDIGTLAREYDAPAVVFLGHGSTHSIAGLTESTFPTFPSAKVIWIYACNCGRSLIDRLGNSKLAVFGYVTGILAPHSIEATVASRIKRLMEDYAGSMKAKDILLYIQCKLLDEAVSLVVKAKEEKNGLILIQAALINHGRLSIRFAGGP
jgi:hypothetical protein